MKKLSVAAITMMLLSGCAITPTPLLEAEIDAKTVERLENVTRDQEVIAAPLTLYEAMARALKYNLDHKVEIQEQALRSRELNLAQYDLLPQLIANGAYTGRNNFSGASSSQLLGSRTVGEQSLVASTSAERNFVNADITLSWDILDFGLSYIRAKQQADEVLIAAERRRRVATRIIEDVRTAYWRSVSAERLVRDLRELEGEITRALESSTKAFEERKVPPLSALTYQRELLTIQEEIQNIERELVVAKKQLAALINVNPGESFELAIPDRNASRVSFNKSPEEAIQVAMRYRPELLEITYRQRINKKEADAALLELLPSLRVYGGFNYSSNDFLFNNNFVGWGAQASKNLIEAFRYPARKKTVNAQQDLLDQRALALTMAVMTQVHVSLVRFEVSKRRAQTAETFNDVQSKILDQIGAGFDTKRISRQTFIRERMNTIVAEAKYDIAISELQNAYANIYSSMGIDPVGNDLNPDDDVRTLATKLEQYWRGKGDLIILADQATYSEDNGVVAIRAEDKDAEIPAKISKITKVSASTDVEDNKKAVKTASLKD